jgi:NAD(P)-dependent dehydrogenase (short-subunit alcohol dehydrogenase family)
MTVTGNIGIIRFGKINFNDLQLEHTFNPLKATLQAVFAKEIYFLSLAKKLEGTGVTTNTFSPGLVKSQLGRNAPVFLRPFIHAAMAFLPNHCKQAVFLASDKSIEKMTGMHYENGRAMEFKHRYFTSENFQKLNEASEKLSYS